MKILYYSPHPYLNLSDESGYATHMNEMIAAFKRQHHDVSVLIMGGEQRDTVSYQKQQSKTKQIVKLITPKFIWESIKDFNLIRFDKHAKNKLEEKILKFNPDIVYERYNYCQKSGHEICQKYNIKHYIEINTPYTFERSTYQGKSYFLTLADKIEHKVFVNAFRLIVVSSALQNHFTDKHKLSKEQFTVAPNAVNFEKIQKDFDSEVLRKKIKLSGSSKVIGFVGSVSEWHGIDVLVGVHQSLIHKGHDVVTLIVGGGQALNKIKKKVVDLKLEQTFIFAGSVKHYEVFNYIGLFDIAIMPKSNWYGSPIKIFEYGAMKKAIIAPKTIPVLDVMKHREDGLLSEMNAESITPLVEELIENPSYRAKLANNFYHKVLSNYTWDRISKKVLDE